MWMLYRSVPIAPDTNAPFLGHLSGASMQGHVTMSQSELSRLQILQRVIERRMTQAAAAHALGLSYRQVKRLMARFHRQGASGLVSGKRGKQGNRRLPAIYTGHVLDLVRGKAIQQPRARRQYFGELIQIDGSEHRWFEDRGAYCTVLTYVDDATSSLPP